MKDADRYIWLLANMGRVEAEARKWNPRTDRPLLKHLQDFIDREAPKDGALVELKNGNWMCGNAGAHTNVYKPKGRPQEMQGGKRRNVYIDDASWAKAVELGNGNASYGIRVALAKS